MVHHFPYLGTDGSDILSRQFSETIKLFVATFGESPLVMPSTGALPSMCGVTSAMCGAGCANVRPSLTVA
jgi:hypothetical protein